MENRCLKRYVIWQIMFHQRSFSIVHEYYIRVGLEKKTVFYYITKGKNLLKLLETV